MEGMTEPTQCEIRWSGVLASFDRHYESLIADHPDAKQEIDLVRTAIATIGQLIQKSPSLNGNGTVWKQMTVRAKEEKGVPRKHLDGKALFTGPASSV
jgi:hypothetical protein